MDLKMIERKTCIHCGARTVKESCTGYHCNGQPNETREYKCGHRVQWAPNFNRLVIEEPCPNSAEIKAQKAKRSNAQLKTMALVNSLDVDDKWKKRILDALDTRWL